MTQVNDFDFEVGEFNQQAPQSGTEDTAVAESQILNCVQGVGSIKSVGGVDVYVKSAACEDHLRSLIHHLKFDSEKRPAVKQLLGTWCFLQRDLLPLLIFHDKDKKLTFLTLMVLVQLTEPVTEECLDSHRQEILK